jgi:fumarate hydratase class II
LSRQTCRSKESDVDRRAHENRQLGEVKVPADKLWGADPAFARIFQYRFRTDAAPDDLGLRNPEEDIVKIDRTHMQDATPPTLGQEWSGYAAMLTDDLKRIDDALVGCGRQAARAKGRLSASAT